MSDTDRSAAGFASPSTPYTILVTVYGGDDRAEFDEALESCVRQTYRPDEVLVVADGPLTDELDAVLDRYSECYPDVLKRHQLPENRGRGAAARAGLQECANELVGIMSADDVNVPERFERQVGFLERHHEVDAVGGYIAEFSDDPDDVDTVRTVPTDIESVKEMARFRNPMNEVTVLFRKSAVLSAGSYREVDRMEDYDLWVRLIQDGAALTNVPEVLVKVRAGEELFGRRGGFEYAREEVRQQISFLRRGFIGPGRFLLNLALRVPIRFVPNGVRSWVYRRLFRRTPDSA